MSRVMPFAALRPPRGLAVQVAAPPYDVVNSDEARAYARGNPRSFFRVSRPEVDFPAGTDEHSAQVYARGRDNLRELISNGTLVADDSPRFYAYRQRMGKHVQVGLVACASVAEYDQALIKKHELTRKDKEDDRTQHIDVLGGNDEPVFLTYRARPDLDGLMAHVVSGAPEYDFVTEDGIGHTLWVIARDMGERIQRAFTEVPVLYIADGHHRSAAASRVHALRKGKPGEHDAFLAVIFPHDQMQIMDYNRVVKDLRGQAPAAFLKAVEQHFTVTPTTEKQPGKLHDFGMYLGGNWYRLTARPGSWKATVLGELDVNILQENVLGPLLGIGDPRTDKRIHFVGGIRGMGELEKLVDKEGWAVAFSMFPTTLPQLMAIADAGEIMPPKSTWFEPKLRSGLFLHVF
ncbi:MAG: DUF1015 domain-containing protein [Deltaproteobacteria bacterium]|nr:DUF1015 domain-containing protein [Deltaproteobacteria bacterium]